MKHICNVSGGACSFWAIHRTIEAHGKENTVGIFADVLVEHADLYEFNRHTEEVLGIKLIRVSRELTPMQLFAKEGLIGNARFPICSVRLKREPLNEWMGAHYELDGNQENFLKEHASVVLGFDWTEWGRVSDFQAEHPTWTLEAPMCEAPLWDKCEMIARCLDLGFKAQTLYELGFPHNNCGGACVRAGITQWVMLYHTQPITFGTWETDETNVQAEFLRRGIFSAHFTILKDRRNGTTRPLPLRELRARIESGEKFPTDQWGGCGCGGATEPPIYEQEVKAE